jgi:putative transposase
LLKIKVATFSPYQHDRGAKKKEKVTMSKRAKKTKKKEEQFQTILPMAEVMKAELFDMVVLFGIEQVAEIFEKERERICGPRYCNDSSRIAYRAGHVDTALPLGGRMVTVSRPRVRSKDGKKEIPLESVEMLRTSEPLTTRMTEQMVIGVSTRNYTRSLEPVPEKLNSRGTSKSSVSRAFVASTQKKMNQFLKRELSSVAAAKRVGATAQTHASFR